MTEEYIDEVINPQLLQIAKDCKERGIDFIAMVEWENDKASSTAQIANNGIAMKMAYGAMQARGNFDSFAWAMMRHAREHGHSSVTLMQLGVPLKPENEKEITCPK